MWSQKVHTQLHEDVQHVPQKTMGAAVPSLKHAVRVRKAIGFVPYLTQNEFTLHFVDALSRGHLYNPSKG